MIRYAVAMKDGDWTVFEGGEPLTSGISRSAAIEMAKRLAFDAEERGETVELLIQGYYGDVTSRISGDEDAAV
jgi:galactokinase